MLYSNNNYNSKNTLRIKEIKHTFVIIKDKIKLALPLFCLWMSEVSLNRMFTVSMQMHLFYSFNNSYF